MLVGEYWNLFCMNTFFSYLNLRPTSTRMWKEDAKTQQGRDSFCRDTARLWTNAHQSINSATLLLSAKSLIKKHCKTLHANIKCDSYLAELLIILVFIEIFRVSIISLLLSYKSIRAYEFLINTYM